MFRYKFCEPVRILLLVSATFLSLPCIFRDELMNFYTIPIFYFFGSYFFFINFPKIGEVLHGKPTYVEDLVLSYHGNANNTFKKMYAAFMNFLLAILFAAFSEYIIIRGIRQKPLLEVFAIIGGNLRFYMIAQNWGGKALVFICNFRKSQEEKRLSCENHMKFVKRVDNDNIDNVDNSNNVEMYSSK
jgi:hypothetical protein